MKLPSDPKEAKELLKNTQVPWIPRAGEEISKSYYDVCKNRQHGINYGRSYHSIAMMEHINQKEAKRSVEAHLSANPGIALWHSKVRGMLLKYGVETTPVGYRRQYFGNPKDGHTFKEALANGPQNMSVTILNTALYRIYRDLDPSRIQLLHQGHDSWLGQVKIGDSDIDKEIDKRMRVEVEVIGADGKTRSMIIPCKITRGKNWGEMK